MAKEILSVGDLRRKSEVTNDEIDAAAYAYLADPKPGLFRFACGSEIDLAAAVKEYPPAVAAVADPHRTPKFRWTMVRTAILLAEPVTA